jgi:hypothetical protein
MLSKGETLCSESLQRHSRSCCQCSVSRPPWRGPRLEEAPRAEDPAPLGVLGRRAVRAHGLACPVRSRIPRGRPALGTPWDVQGALAVLQRFPTQPTRRCETLHRLAPLLCQRRVASRNCGDKANCPRRLPTQICSDGVGLRRRVAPARAYRSPHGRTVLAHSSQAFLLLARS